MKKLLLKYHHTHSLPPYASLLFKLFLCPIEQCSRREIKLRHIYDSVEWDKIIWDIIKSQLLIIVEQVKDI